MKTEYPFYLFFLKKAGLHPGEALASMAGISVSRTPYKLFDDYFWLLPLNWAFLHATLALTSHGRISISSLSLIIIAHLLITYPYVVEADRKTSSSDLI